MQNNEEMEYELTFLAAHLPDLDPDIEPEEIIDVYFPEDASVHPKLRVRKAGEVYQITKKVPSDTSDASAHIETSIRITEAEFTSLTRHNARYVRKQRYNTIIDGRVAEVDVFQDNLAGLVVIDFEFPSQEELRRFEKPDCCLADVTQEDFIAGGLLAGKSYEDIRHHLEVFKYIPNPENRHGC